MITIAWMSYREALHSRWLGLCLGGLLVLMAIAGFAGEVVISGGDALRVGIVAWGARWFGILALVLFCTHSITREDADKVTELWFALPARRTTIYFGKLAGLLLLALYFALLAGAAACIYADSLVGVRWALSLYFELAIVAAFVLWVVTATGSAVGSILLTLAFYLLARAMQAISAMAAGPLFQPDSRFDHFVAAMVEALSWALPPLYDYASADWLITGVVGVELPVQFVRTVIYLLLLSGITLIELYRKPL